MEQDDIRRHLLRAYVRSILAPAIAETRQLDLAVDATKQEFVQYLEKLGLSIEEIAEVADKSDRWVYRWLHEGSADDLKRLPYRLMIQLFLYCAGRHPEWVTIDEACGFLSELIGEHVREEAVKETLRLFTKGGLLQEELGKWLMLRAFEDVSSMPIGRLERVSEPLNYLWPLTRDYALGKDNVEFAGFEATLTSSAYRDFVSKMREFSRQALAEAVAVSTFSDSGANKVRVTGIITFGYSNKV